ncbi:ROK family transcriptional regulator [Phycicoccus sp. DTK01]|uniref:ROK family transcriptional regulator n=1 Tax=Phycicoccus sp. DTK01 TaxID=2785745 RepID=UPI001A90AF47|nr:ROK family transcriptional regulator [Phycicoccus sp. DTK01]GIL36709.1 sugar kinase [Phycicoccus sp. DTK01]
MASVPVTDVGEVLAPARAAVPPRLSRAGEVLELVRSGRATTISELAAAMNVARSTVTDRVDALVERGLVVAQGEMVAGRGRPATVLAFNPAAGVVLSAQIGMSGIRVGAYDLAGEPLAAEESTDIAVTEGPERVLAVLEARLDAQLEAAGRTRDDVLGVGIGMPGRIELETAREGGSAAARPWVDYPVADRLRTSYGVPVAVGRGVALLAVAEHRAFHPEASVLLGLKVGTVVECGVVVEGRIVGGGSGLAGEIGHTPVPDIDTICVCGNRGCLNAVAGGGALARDLARLGHDVDSARGVAELAQAGVVEAGLAVREAGRRIGAVLAGTVNLLNPDVIVVWGYLADAGDQLFAGLQESLYRMGVPAATRHVQIGYTRLGVDAGVRGAAVSTTEEILDPTNVDHLLATWRSGSSVAAPVA